MATFSVVFLLVRLIPETEQAESLSYHLADDYSGTARGEGCRIEKLPHSTLAAGLSGESNVTATIGAIESERESHAPGAWRMGEHKRSLTDMRPLIQIRVVQFDGAAMPDVHFSFRPVVGTEYQQLQGSYNPGSGVYTFLIDDYKRGLHMLRIEAPGYPVIEKKAEFRDAGYSGDIFLIDDDTECAKMGGRRVYFKRRPELVGVYISGDESEKVKDRVKADEEVRAQLWRSEKKRLLFERATPKAERGGLGKDVHQLMRDEFPNAIINDQIIETIGGRIEFLSRQIGVELVEGAEWESVQRELGLNNVRLLYRDPHVPSYYVLVIESAERYAVLDVVEAFLQSALVKSCEPQLVSNDQNCAQVLPGDLLRPWQWHLKPLRLFEAWGLLKDVNPSLTFGSADIILAIHDAGIETSGGGIVQHPDLKGGITGGNLTGYLGGKNDKVYYQYDFSLAPGAAMVKNNDSIAADLAADLANNESLAKDLHGIWVAGVAAAKSDGTSGIVGTAPNVRLASFKRKRLKQTEAANDIPYLANHIKFMSGLDPQWSATTILYAAGQVFPEGFNTGGNAGPGASVINFSHVQQTLADQTLQEALRRVTLLGRNRRGVILVGAAGNSDSDTLDFVEWGPHLNVLKIAASSFDHRGYEILAAYSSFSTKIDPGLDVCAPSNNRWLAKHNPPRYYGVITLDEISLLQHLTDNLPGSIAAQAVIQNNLPAGSTFLTLLPQDMPSFPLNTEVLIRNPADNEIIEHNTIEAAPAGAPGNSLGLATPLDTDFPANSSLIKGPSLGGSLGYVDTFGGTSAAAPMISGIVALMLTANPRLTWAEVRQILRDTAVPIAIRFAGPGTERDKKWVDQAAAEVIDANGVMLIPGGAPTVTLTTQLSKGDTQIAVPNAQAFNPRQALTIGAETTLAIATDPSGAAAPPNQLTVVRGDDFETGDTIFIGKLIETIIDADVNAVAGTIVRFRVINPDGFVVDDVLDIGGQQVILTSITGVNFAADPSDNPRIVFRVETVGQAAFAAVKAPAVVKISGAQRGGPFKITAKAGNQLTLNANVTMVHPAGRIIQKENTEVAVVKQVVSPGMLEVYPLINDHLLDNTPKNLHITGGRIAFYSHGFGYGRVDALEAVKAAINFTHNDRDIVIRNFMDDDGVTNRAAEPVHSPDLWVINGSPTPAGLAYSIEGPHQQPRTDICAPIFVGSGLNDLSVSGTFTGAAVTNYIIEITTAGAIDKFTWRKEGGTPSAAIDITATTQDIDVNGLSITFSAVTGHTVGDKWYIRCEKITNRFVHLRLRNRGVRSTFAASAYEHLTTPVNQYRIFLCLSDGTPVSQYYPRAAVGLDDLSVVSHYNGAKDIITIKISDTTGAADSFVWSKGSGGFSPPIAITGWAKLIQDGVSIQFGAVTGHVLNDTWVLKCHPDAQKFINIDHFILSNPIAPFSLAANRPGTWLMDEQTFPVLAAGEDQYYSVVWPENNRPPRNGFGVAEPGWPLRMFIMGEVVPHDGLLMGDVAEQDNNFSYREIIFARFGFKKSNLVEEIASYVEVDSFGTVANEDFKVNVVSDVSTFDADAVKVELVIEFDNGTTDTKVFEFNGGAWGFAGGTPNWCTLGPPKQADGVTNATGEQYYMTFSGSLNVSRQYKNVKVTPKIYSTVNTAVVLAEETRTVAVYEQAQLASGRYAGVSPAALVPQSHFFADPAGLMQQPAAIAYGPQISGPAADKFRVTSLFKAANDVNAYAIVDGVIMLQRVADPAITGNLLPDVVNLVIKPYKQAMLGFTPVKYFIYRNLRLDDFLKGVSAADDKLVRASANASAFIQGLWAVHTAQNGAVPFESLVLGYDPANQPGADKIDRVFYRQDPNKQLPLVTRGINIGKFYANAGNDEFGLEIVLEEGEFQPDYDYVRKYKEVIIDVSAMLTGTDKEKLSVRLERERILNYIDSAAFFGMHMAKDGWLQVDDGTGNKTKLSGADIYDNVITRFHTKNTLYLDVRNENGLSLNFYAAYNDGSGNALEVGDTSGSLTAQKYASDEWPLIIRPSSSVSSANDYSLVFLRLRRDYNKKAILYLEHGQSDGPTTKGRFIADEDLIAAGAAKTNALGFRFPNKDLGSGNRIGVAWMLKMHYTMRQDATNAPFPSEVVPTATYLDNLFGPVDIDPLWAVGEPVIAWLSAQDRKYIDGEGIAGLGFEHIADRGVAFSQWTGTASMAGTVLFYAAAKDSFANGNKKFVPNNGLTGGVSKRGSFFEEAMLFDGYSVGFDVIVDGGNEVLTMNLQESPPNPRPAEAMLLLGLTRSELETHLKPLAGFDTRYPRTLLLDEVTGSPFTDVNGEQYRKFKMGLRGIDDTGKAHQAFPATDVIVYTSDRCFFFSNAFTQAQLLPTVYERNYEEGFGVTDHYGETYPIFAVAGNTVTVPSIDLTREIVPGDRVNIKGVDYSVSDVTFSGADSVLTLSTAPAATPGTDTVRGPNKPIEDYFIAKDRLGASSGDRMEALVNDFVTGVNAIPDDTTAPAAIESLVNNYGPKILQRARLICSQSGFPYADDRILYWARIKMQSNMKNHPYFLHAPKQRNRLEKLLETKSRGYDAATFSAAGARKKVLMTGYDPFKMDANIRRSNPSGAAVLALHGDVSAGGMDFCIQTAIFPVRFADFDHNPPPDVGTGVAESFVERFINPGHPGYIAAEEPDMILTLSQADPFEFWVDRFASRTRGPVSDNMSVSGLPFPETVPGDQFYETTLPEQKLVPVGNQAGVFKVFYNNVFEYKWNNAGKEVKGEYLPKHQADNTIRKIEDPLHPDHAEDPGHPEHATLHGSVPTALTNTTTPKKTEITAVKGSGGHYLSNEIFYRVSRLRTLYNPTMKTGHYHLPKIQHDHGKSAFVSAVNGSVKTSEDFRADLVRQLIEEIRNALVRAFS